MVSRSRARCSFTEAGVRATLDEFDPLWAEHFPAELACIVQILVERVDVTESGISLRLRTEGLTSLVAALPNMSPGGRVLTVHIPLAIRNLANEPLVSQPSVC